MAAWAAAAVLYSCTANQREAAVPARPSAEPSRPAVIIETPAKTLTFEVEVADTPKSREVGLMFRNNLPADRGMIFVFETAEDHHFWMKNTYISLDMIFIGDDLRIAGIIHEAVPENTESRSVGRPSRYVLEVQGGTARKEGIVEGQKVTFRGIAATR
ncbi:MAG: DUF192 domain-containing protein [Deltaproteobacteria bacterium]|nr:DUF192 domain-containing protein [Deltaproteobacteria bacterium]